MKQAILSRVVLLAMAASLAGLFGCDEEKDDNSLMTTLAASGALCGDWMVISPEDGATDVDTNISLELEHNGDLLSDLDEDEYDDIEITLKYNDGRLVLNYDNFKMLISGNSVVGGYGKGYLSNTKYSSITIAGFKDAEGNPIPKCWIMNYDFTTGD